MDIQLAPYCEDNISETQEGEFYVGTDHQNFNIYIQMILLLILFSNQIS